MSKSRSIPEELIRIKAHQFWEKRQREDGTPESDWEEAVNYLKKHWWEVPYWKFRQGLTKTLQSLWNIPKFVIWDLPTYEWAKLLAAPLVLSLAGAWITNRLQEEDKKNETLKKYFDQIEYLVFKEDLLTAKPGSPVRIIAKSRSLTVLRDLDLDVKRKELVISFLEASNLINRNNNNDGISLAYLDLKKINLSGFNLEGAELIQTNLKKANLDSVNLIEANLRGADLENTNLFLANLRGAILEIADLAGAMLGGANLNGANLNGASLKDAKLAFANLADTYLGFANLKDANLFRTDLLDANFEHASLKNASFQDANFAGASLENARLEGAYLINVQNLTFSQIKSACNWEQAIYKEDNSDNEKYIEELRGNEPSEPLEPS